MKDKLILKSRLRAALCCSLCALLGAFAPIAHAQTVQPTVLFNGTAQTFTFQNVTTNVDSAGESVPDLFPNLKSIVPGDSITQNVTLSLSQIPSNQTVTIYLQAQSANDDYDALLESATLRVVHDGTEITQSLSQPVALGVFDSAVTEQTAITLSVPVTAGNEVSGLNANIDWVFSAQYTPDPTPTPGATSPSTNRPDSPKTSDANLLWWWIAFGSSAGCGMAILLHARMMTKK